MTNNRQALRSKILRTEGWQQIFLLLLLTMTFFSLRVAAMISEEESPIKSSCDNSAFASAEVTARNRRLYDPESSQENNTPQEQATENDSTCFNGEALFQKWREAEDAAIFWKTKHEDLPPQTLIAAEVEQRSISEEAHRDYDYWTQVSHECSDFIQRNQELDAAHQDQIFDLVTAANEAATEAQKTFELFLKKDSSLSAELVEQVAQNSEPSTSTAEATGLKTENQLRNPKFFTTPSSRTATLMEGGYLFPDKGGRTFNGLKYTQHALERMAPATPEIIKLLRSRAFERAKLEGLNFDDANFDDANPLKFLRKSQSDDLKAWWHQYGPDLRAILPSTVEAEIANPNSTDLKVITSPEGIVITAMRKSCLNNPPISSSLLTLKSSTASYPTLFHSAFLSNLFKPETLTDQKNKVTKNELLPLKLDRFNLQLPLNWHSPLSSQSMSFAAHEAASKQRSRLLKNIDAIKTLQRKRERDLKLRKLQDTFFEGTYLKSVLELDQNTTPITSKQLDMSRVSLETVLKNMRKKASENSKFVLRKKLFSNSIIEKKDIILRRPTSSQTSSNLEDKKTLFTKLTETKEVTKKEKTKTQKQKKKKPEKKKTTKTDQKIT